MKNIDLQANISKEYNVIDLEPTSESKNPGEKITTVHREEEVDEDPKEDAGMYPNATGENAPAGLRDRSGAAADKVTVVEKDIARK